MGKVRVARTILTKKKKKIGFIKKGFLRSEVSFVLKVVPLTSQ